MSGRVMMPVLVNQPRKKGLSGPLAVLCLAFGLRFLPEPAASLAFVVLSVLALRGPGPSLLALTGVCVLSSLNPELVPNTDGAIVGRYLVYAVVLMGAATRWISEWPQGIFLSRPVAATALLAGFVIVHSLTASSIPTLSLLKALLWGLIMCAVLGNWRRLTGAAHSDTVQDIERALQIVLLASAPLLYMPSGFALNETGFQGLLNHPQLLGVLAALAATLVACRLLAATGSFGWQGALLIFYVYLILRSESRTALFGMVLGLGLAIAVQGVRHGSLRVAMPLCADSARLFAIVVIGVALAGFWVAGGTIQDFLRKSGRADVSNVVEAYDVSRGLLIAQMLENIQRRPLVGIGFGVPSVPEMQDLVRDPYFGIPLSAPVEKGVMPIAVIEEFGVLGAAAILAWLLMGFRRAVRSGLCSTAVLFTVLALNLGEAALFSVGGGGLLQMLLIGAVYTSWIGKRIASVPSGK